MVKKTIVRIGGLLLLLPLFNFIYSRYLYEADIQEHAAIIELVRDLPADTDILYIGESSNTAFHSDDFDQRPISALIGDAYLGLAPPEVPPKSINFSITASLSPS